MYHNVVGKIPQAENKVENVSQDVKTDEKVNKKPKSAIKKTFLKKKPPKEYDPMSSHASRPVSGGNDDMYHHTNTNVDPRYVPEKKEVKIAGSEKIAGNNQGLKVTDVDKKSKIL